MCSLCKAALSLAFTCQNLSYPKQHCGTCFHMHFCEVAYILKERNFLFFFSEGKININFSCMKLMLKV